MFIYFILSATLIIVLLSFSFVIKVPGSIYLRISNAVFAISLSAFVFNFGGWIYISLYLKYIYAVVFAVFVFRYFFKSYSTEFLKGKKGLITAILLFPFVVFTVYLNILYLNSNKFEGDYINISSPFRFGKYAIMQGGSNQVNFFHRERNFSKYSYDIVRLNEFGNRALGIVPDDMNKYCIFGTDVYSPVSGTIIGLINNIPDNKPGEINLSHKAGNFVLIKSENVTLMLAHLQMNSIVVNKGDNVTFGSPIGKIGNSGNSIEPHLHIEATTKSGETNLPVAIMIDGVFFRYNETF